MSDDERAIRDLIADWLRASKAGDTATVLSLMTEDAVFMVPGQAPFGREAFSQRSQAQTGMTIDGSANIRELQVFGDWAFARSFLDLAITPRGATSPLRRTGWTLTIFRKERDGRWRLARDANLLTAEE